MKRFRLVALLMVFGIASPAGAFEWFRPFNQPDTGVEFTSESVLTSPIEETASDGTPGLLTSHLWGSSWSTHNHGCGCGGLWGGFCHERGHVGCGHSFNFCWSKLSCWKPRFHCWKPRIHCRKPRCGCHRFGDLFAWPVFRAHGSGCGCQGGTVIESQEPLAPPMPDAIEAPTDEPEAPTPTAESTTNEGWKLLPQAFHLWRIPLGA